jgi:hypothetical protein
MWSAQSAAVGLAFLLGVAVIGMAETILSFQASNCAPQQQQGGHNAPDHQRPPADQQRKDGSAQGGHEAVGEPFVCSVAGLPTAIRVFMNHNEGFVVGGFTFLLVFVTGWLVWATLGLRASTDRLWDAGERQMELIATNAAQQSRDMQDSIKVSQASAKAAAQSAEIAERGVAAADRAWIEIDVSLMGDLVFSENEVLTKAKAVFKNVGRSPATNVSIWIMLKADCAAASQYTDDSTRGIARLVVMGDYGQVLFPGRDASLEREVSITRSEFLARIKEMDEVPPSDGEERVPFTHNHPTLLAFARYTLPAEGVRGRYHYSTAIFEIAVTDPEHPGFDGSVVTFKLGELELVGTVFSGKNT